MGSLAVRLAVREGAVDTGATAATCSGSTAHEAGHHEASAKRVHWHPMKSIEDWLRAWGSALFIYTILIVFVFDKGGPDVGAAWVVSTLLAFWFGRVSARP